MPTTPVAHSQQPTGHSPKVSIPQSPIVLSLYTFSCLWISADAVRLTIGTLTSQLQMSVMKSVLKALPTCSPQVVSVKRRISRHNGSRAAFYHSAKLSARFTGAAALT